MAAPTPLLPQYAVADVPPTLPAGVPSYNATATLPAKMRPKTYDEIRAKVLEAPRPILTQKGKKK